MLTGTGICVDEARLAVGLRLRARERAGRRTPRPRQRYGSRRSSIIRETAAIVQRLVRHGHVLPGLDARQQRPHRPTVGEHRILALGLELRLPDHVQDRVQRPGGRRPRAAQGNQPERHQADQQQNHDDANDRSAISGHATGMPR